MRALASTIMLMCLAAPFNAVGQSGPDLPYELDKSFPLHIQITSTTVGDPIPPKSAAEGESIGMAPLYFVIYRGKMNGEDHWIFSCQRENRLHESNPCTDLPPAEYRGRWIHDHNLVQVLGGSSSDQIARFWQVAPNPNISPALSDDPVYQFPVFDFETMLPKGRVQNDYSVLVHIYGGVALDFSIGQIPSRTQCTSVAWTAQQTTTTCSAYPPIDIHRGTVTMEVSMERITYASINCDVKWHWSKCAVVAPGFYYARLDNKDHLILLTHDDKGQPNEITFQVQLPPDRPASKWPLK
jgi:hypothetical protein